MARRGQDSAKSGITFHNQADIADMGDSASFVCRVKKGRLASLH